MTKKTNFVGAVTTLRLEKVTLCIDQVPSMLGHLILNLSCLYLYMCVYIYNYIHESLMATIPQLN